MRTTIKIFMLLVIVSESRETDGGSNFNIFAALNYGGLQRSDPSLLVGLSVSGFLLQGAGAAFDLLLEQMKNRANTGSVLSSLLTAILRFWPAGSVTTLPAPSLSK